MGNTLFLDLWLDDMTLKHQYLRLCALESSNKLAWQKNESGFFGLFLPSCEFHVKSVLNLIDDSLLPHEDVPIRWVNVIPIKIDVFAWRVQFDKLPTRLNLSLRAVDLSSILCLLCNISVESGSHLFFSCLLARRLRSKAIHWWELEYSFF
ncbi:RNA-directed DNA polymerase, eukaryota [Tanacetum coccineum]|uniref:RNA-directed DNA polymerase, eukaryota n=1 Tax=Tanacetum coccineum TaxID=301880 RepID=A0ABQ5FG59_9ASTR